MEHAADGRAMGRADPHPTDEVDDLVAAWQAERPDLDVRPMQVLSRISRLARHLDRERRSAFAAHDLESWEFDVLAALRRQGAPYELSPGALLRATLVTSGTMTNRIDRLKDKGLVRRRRDPQEKADDDVPDSRTSSRRSRSPRDHSEALHTRHGPRGRCRIDPCQWLRPEETRAGPCVTLQRFPEVGATPLAAGKGGSEIGAQLLRLVAMVTRAAERDFVIGTQLEEQRPQPHQQ